jgi:hypothetical protein
MTYPYISFKCKKTSVLDFVDFWSSFIVLGKNDSFYSSRINKSSFNRNDIDKFYTWKNGMKINNHQQKGISVQFIKKNLTSINRLKKNFDLKTFNNTFKSISPIWQIFLLHLINPNQFPIFDQHVYRAHFYLMQKKIEEIPRSKKDILNYYHDSYLPFFITVAKDIPDKRKIDQALGLGQFLKSKYVKAIS